MCLWLRACVCSDPAGGGEGKDRDSPLHDIVSDFNPVRSRALGRAGGFGPSSQFLEFSPEGPPPAIGPCAFALSLGWLVPWHPLLIPPAAASVTRRARCSRGSEGYPKVLVSLTSRVVSCDLAVLGAVCVSSQNFYFPLVCCERGRLPVA